MKDNIVYMDWSDLDLLRSRGQAVEKVDDGYIATISFTDSTRRWSIKKVNQLASGLAAPLIATKIVE